jgi:hypothetical protein
MQAGIKIQKNKAGTKIFPTVKVPFPQLFYGSRYRNLSRCSKKHTILAMYDARGQLKSRIIESFTHKAPKPHALEWKYLVLIEKPFYLILNFSNTADLCQVFFAFLEIIFSSDLRPQ